MSRGPRVPSVAECERMSDDELVAELGRLEMLAFEKGVPMTPAPEGWDPGMDVTRAHLLQRLTELRDGFDSGVRDLRTADLFRLLKNTKEDA